MAKVIDWLTGKSEPRTVIVEDGPEMAAPPAPPDERVPTDDEYLDPHGTQGRIVILLSEDRNTILPVRWQHMTEPEAASIVGQVASLFTSKIAGDYLAVMQPGVSDGE